MYSNDLEFQKISAAYQPKILRYLARMVGDEEAADLAQEVFVKANQALPDFRGESQPSTWLYRIASNTVYDWLRSSTYRRMAQNKPLDGAPGDDMVIALDDRNPWTGEKTPPIDQQCIRQEMNSSIRSYVERLPEIYVTCLFWSNV